MAGQGGKKQAIYVPSPQHGFEPGISHVGGGEALGVTEIIFPV